MAAAAFAKHERARERGEDIAHKEHQKRLKTGLPIYRMSRETEPSRQRELVAAHHEWQLQQLASGRPSPLPAARGDSDCVLDPLREASGFVEAEESPESNIVSIF